MKYSRAKYLSKFFNCEIGASVPNWFGTDARADILFKPNSIAELQSFLRNTKPQKLSIIGCCSNSIISDNGIDGVTIKLSSDAFSSFSIKGNHIEAGAGSLDALVSKAAAENELSGLEFLSTIPGSIGGAVKMNAGSFNQETFDNLEYIKCMDYEGNIFFMEKNDISHGYRFADIGEGNIILSAVFKLKPFNKEAIYNHIRTINKKKILSQPVHARTGGSTFCNPSGRTRTGCNRKAWELIQLSGLQRIKYGGASVSEKHSNFIINSNGSASDINYIIEAIKTAVKQKFGILLQAEIKKIGRWE